MSRRCSSTSLREVLERCSPTDSLTPYTCFVHEVYSFIIITYCKSMLMTTCDEHGADDDDHVDDDVR